jgi:hypothetical protein
MENSKETKNQKSSNKIPWNTLGAIGSFLSSLLALLALIIGIYQFRSQIKEMKFEREQKIKLDRPILSINDNLVFDFKGNKQIKLVIENVGVRPAYNVNIKTIVLRQDSLSSKLVYNQNDYSTNFTNPIFKEKKVNFINELPLTINAEYFIKVTLRYFEENKNIEYIEDFYFKWKHSEDKDYLQDALYGIEEIPKIQIEEFIKKNKNK